MKTINITTATMIMMALELISFSYAPNREKQKIMFRSLCKKTKSMISGSTAVPEDNATPDEPRYRTAPRNSGDYVRYRVFLTDDKYHYLSAFHDVHLGDRDGKFNMVVEMTQGAVVEARVNAAMALNPIAVEMMGKRDHRNVVGVTFPNGRGLPWNQGVLPQTWNDPATYDPRTKRFGDGGQMIVLEIGGRNQECGQVIAVRVLYAYATTNVDNRTDWIVVAIAADDPNVDSANERFSSAKILKWLERTGRTVAAGMPLSASEAAIVIKEKHQLWKRLQQQTIANSVSLANTTLKNSSTVDQYQAKIIVEKS